METHFPRVAHYFMPIDPWVGAIIVFGPNPGRAVVLVALSADAIGVEVRFYEAISGPIRSLGHRGAASVWLSTELRGKSFRLMRLTAEGIPLRKSATRACAATTAVPFERGCSLTASKAYSRSKTSSSSLKPAGNRLVTYPKA